MEKYTETKLVETYSYARVYHKGNELKKHTDRVSCKISTTMNLGGDSWKIYLELKNKKTKSFELNPGDMLIYQGEQKRNKYGMEIKTIRKRNRTIKRSIRYGNCS